jgi:hypothetical protein
MIIARSFARIHETNLKVSIFGSLLPLSHVLNVPFIIRNKESYPYGLPIRMTTAGLDQGPW